MTTVLGMFEQSHDADRAVSELMQNGFAKNQIGVVARHEVLKEAGLTTGSGAEIGAITGATAGGIAGLLIGLGAIVIPGVGPIIAAGAFLTWVGATVLGLAAGAVGGGMVGALTGFGFSEARAERYAEGIKAGHILVTVQAPAERADAAAEILRRNNATEVDVGGAEMPATLSAPVAAQQSYQSTLQ